MLRLVTIPISHFCEKARWALDYAEVRYHESAHLPLFHLVAVRRAGGKRTVPVLKTPHGTLRQSTDIVRFADRHLPPERRLYPERDVEAIDRLVAELDKELGVDTRLWAYAQVMPNPELGRRIGMYGAPRGERFVASSAYPLVARVMKQELRITPDNETRATERIDRWLDRLDGELADGRPYLMGDRFTAADLTFAALCAPIVGPGEYHVPLPKPDQLSPEAAERMRAWRERPSGRHALEMFRRHRQPSAATAREPEQRKQQVPAAE